MSTLLKPLQARERLLKQNLRIFSSHEFSQLFAMPAYAAKHFLEKQTKQGFLVRLKRGIYTLKTDFPGEEEIANALYKPSYLSFEYALAYYGILPEMPHKVTSATTKPTRLFATTYELPFAYYSIKEAAYTGYSLVKTNTKSFLIADPEKALADYLYFETLGKRPHNDRLHLNNINKEKLMNYARLFGRQSLINYTGKVYAHC
jgi:predicted transcriptional regulator of viral defense system